VCAARELHSWGLGAAAAAVQRLPTVNGHDTTNALAVNSCVRSYFNGYTASGV
jgi:hypothetical protein